jgi:hypothetical protein
VSALGQKQTSEYVRVMSALPSKADIAALVQGGDIILPLTEVSLPITL